jgi:hypothetical protein
MRELVGFHHAPHRHKPDDPRLAPFRDKAKSQRKVAPTMNSFPIFQMSSVRIALLLVLMATATAACAQTIITFDMPNSISTQPVAINPRSQITGSYVDAVAQHGFLRQPDGTLTSFDAPIGFPGGARVDTSVTSINAAGQITGYTF